MSQLIQCLASVTHPQVLLYYYYCYSIYFPVEITSFVSLILTRVQAPWSYSSLNLLLLAH